MITGEVKLLDENQVKETLFEGMEIGEGVVGTDGTRIKINHDLYLHFTTRGEVQVSRKANWPLRANRKAQRFRLIAEEI